MNFDVILKAMRILILPFIAKPKTGSAYRLTKSLISALSIKRNAIAVSASAENGFRHISLYPETSPDPVHPLHAVKKRSYEQWLAEQGAGTEKYLNKDADTIANIIERFRPDLIIVIDRIAGAAAAKEKKIPCWAVVSSSVYRNVDVSTYMKSFNRFLSSRKMEQVFTLKDLYDTCDKRIGFGPSSVHPFPSSSDIMRIGMRCIRPVIMPSEKRITVYFDDTSIRAGKLRRLLITAFHDRECEVRAGYPGCYIENTGCLKFLPYFREDLLSGSELVIHDGSSWLMDACIARGIPQIIIHDHSYIRSWNGQNLERTGLGIRIPEKELTAERLSKCTAKILNDPSYAEKAAEVMQEAYALGDLCSLYPLLERSAFFQTE